MEDEMKHKHADLIEAWVEDTSIRFTYPRGMAGSIAPIGGIEQVLNNPKMEWSIYKPEKWDKEKEAYARGKVIEFRIDCNHDWSYAKYPNFAEPNEYRIKPKPTNGAVMPCGTVVSNVQEAYIAGQKAASKYYVDKPKDTITKVTKWLYVVEHMGIINILSNINAPHGCTYLGKVEVTV